MLYSIMVEHNDENWSYLYFEILSENQLDWFI